MEYDTPLKTTSAHQHASTEPGTTVATVTANHPIYFYRDGNVVLKVGNFLYKLHQTQILPKIKPLADAMTLPSGGNPTEGTLDNPIELKMVQSDDFDVLLSVIYDTPQSERIFLRSERLPHKQLVKLATISDMFGFDAGFKFAVEKITYSFDVFWSEKLALGLRFSQQDWVRSGVREFYSNAKQKITHEDAGKLGVESGLVFMVLHQGIRLFENLVDRLLNVPPSTHADPTFAWKSDTCDDHNRCMRSITSSWPQVKKKALAKRRLSDGQFSLLTFRDHIEQGFLFPCMNDECRTLFYLEITYRTRTFFDNIADLVVSELLHIREASGR